MAFDAAKFNASYRPVSAGGNDPSGILNLAARQGVDLEGMLESRAKDYYSKPHYYVPNWLEDAGTDTRGANPYTQVELNPGTNYYLVNDKTGKTVLQGSTGADFEKMANYIENTLAPQGRGAAWHVLQQSANPINTADASRLGLSVKNADGSYFTPVAGDLPHTPLGDIFDAVKWPLAVAAAPYIAGSALGAVLPAAGASGAAGAGAAGAAGAGATGAAGVTAPVFGGAIAVPTAAETSAALGAAGLSGAGATLGGAGAALGGGALGGGALSGAGNLISVTAPAAGGLSTGTAAGIGAAAGGGALASSGGASAPATGSTTGSAPSSGSTGGDIGTTVTAPAKGGVTADIFGSPITVPTVAGTAGAVNAAVGTPSVGKGGIAGTGMSATDLAKYLKAGGTLLGLLGGLSQPSTSGVSVPGGFGQLSSKFTDTTLPAANIPGLAPGTGGQRAVSGDPNKYAFGPEQSFFNAVPKARGGALRYADLSPAERETIDYTRRNMATGMVQQNPDGSITSFKGAVEDFPDGSIRYFPTFWNGHVLPVNEARDRAVKSGIDWPKYPTYESALSRENAIHGIMEREADAYRAGDRSFLSGYARGGALPSNHPSTKGPLSSPGPVSGPGDGREDKIPAVLSDGEYVMDAETVSMLGNGSNKAGAQRLDEMRANLRKHKGGALSRGKFSANAKRPEAYFKGGLA